MDRRAVGDALEEIAGLMELKGENPFRCRAFANGARVVAGLPDFEDRVARGTLTEVKGIGQGLATEIDALVRRGASPMLDALRREVPEGLRALATVPGLGPKKARALHDDVGIRSLAELEYACRENRLKALKGFGEKTQAKILESLAARKRHEGKIRRDDARAMERIADEAARACDGRAYAVGGYRRGETVSDGLDLVVAAPSWSRALEIVLGSLPVEEVLHREPKAAVAHLKIGVEVRLLAGPPSVLGMLLLAGTGPESHAKALAALRRPAEGRTFADEESYYRDLGLPFIPPELRGDGSEVAAAREGRLPPILDRSAVRGCVHAHTTWSDGSGTTAEMLDAALGAGLSWFGLSDHSPTATYAGGLTEERLRKQQEEIDAEAAKRPGLCVLKGTESDILADGSLDYPRRVLDRFDFVVASVHSQFTMDRDAMTARVIAAVEDPATSVLGHPTGRLLLGRRGFDLDVPAVLRACAREGVAVELNAHPARLDLDPEWMPLVKELGVVVSIGPDAHEPAGLEDLDHGVAVARRAAIPPAQILNTRDAAAARAFLRRGR